MKIDTFIFQTWKFNVVENLGKVKICEKKKNPENVEGKNNF